MSKRRRSTAVRQPWLMPRTGELRRGPVADVALRLPRHRTYSYAVPPELAADAQPGALVKVPYGAGDRVVEGYCLRVAERDWEHTLKPLAAVASPTHPLSAALVELGEWISRYYVSAPGLVFKTVIGSAPAPRRKRQQFFLKRTAREPGEPLKPRLAALLQAAGEELPLKVALKQAGAGRASLNALIAAGLVEQFAREVEPAAVDSTGAASAPPEEDSFVLTGEQQAAIEQIVSQMGQREFSSTLLFGVPGSGKTEVYVRAIRAAVAAGRQTILLVPEIALATQLIERLARRFERVATVHSQMSGGARAAMTARIARGDVDVVIGTRSAVFAPCARLGLIVVDEEQEGSFKNRAAPYFHARDVAVKRAQLESVPIVLGSATPALETWYNATVAQRYRLLELRTRVPGAELPTATLSTPPAESFSAHQETVLGAELREALRATLAEGEQVILLHNRRGYSVGLGCTQCGFVLRCTQCHAALVLHQSDNSLRCHRCAVRRLGIPQHCENGECGGELRQSGFAIQRLEEELRGLVPAARVLRLDSDTMTHRDDYRAALSTFAAREADVLIGTQMIAKGLDFPGVKLVGMIDADAALYLPDFRASEHAFQLIMQVVGRAGRKHGASRAIVQTRTQPPPAIVAAVRMDFRGFAEAELHGRARYAYPPYVRMARLVFADARPGHAGQAAAQCAAALTGLAARLRPLAAGAKVPDLRIDPPEPCAAARVRELNRFQVIVRATRAVGVQTLLRRAISERLLPSVQRLSIDVDPLDML